MQGIFIDGRRPLNKKHIKDALREEPGRVVIEATSLHGGDYSGPAERMPEGKKVAFVGPDPFTRRKFYGAITRHGATFEVE